MLLGNILTTPTGIRLIDVDGSSIELNAEDALSLSVWLLQQKEPLLEMLRNDLDRARRAARKEQEAS